MTAPARTNASAVPKIAPAPSFTVMVAGVRRLRQPLDHELRVTLPSDFPPGEAEVIVLGSDQSDAGRGREFTVDEFLAARLSCPAGVGP